MATKLLSLQKDNNIIVYSIEYTEKELDDYLKYLSSLYGYKEKATIEAEIIEGKVLSMKKYDLLKKYCKVDEQYKVIEELGQVDDITKRSKIEITVRYYSILVEILRDAFASKEPLVNGTDLIKLTNHVLGYSNNFVFNKMIDLNEKNKAWDDPSRGFLNLDEYNRYIAYKKRSINEDTIKLNKFENKRISKDIDEIITNLRSIFKIEQIGMFPAQLEGPKVLEILKVFGYRNIEFEFFFGSLENMPINIDGANKLNNMAEEIIETYNTENIENDIKSKIEHYGKVKSFLNFKTS